MPREQPAASGTFAERLLFLSSSSENHIIPCATLFENLPNEADNKASQSVNQCAEVDISVPGRRMGVAPVLGGLLQI